MRQKLMKKKRCEIFPLGGLRPGGGGEGEPGYQWWDHHYSLISPPTPPPSLSLSLSAPENLSLTTPGDVQFRLKQ